MLSRKTFYVHTLTLLSPALILIGLASFSRISSGQAATDKATSHTIQSNADEVSLDVVVRTKKGKPLTDLKPEDLAVTDNGTPVKITDMRLMNGVGGDNHLITFVFDRLDSAAAVNARKVTEKVMKEFPATGFSFSVLGIAGRLSLYQNFTPDRKVFTDGVRSATEASREEAKNAIASAEKNLISIARTGADESGAHVNSQQRALAQALLFALQDSQRTIQEQHTPAALAGLLGLARAEGKISGRKVLIYISQRTQENVTEEDTLNTILGAANRSGVSIYSIDANIFNDPTSSALLSSMALGNSVAMTSSRVAAPTATTGPPPITFGAQAAGAGTGSVVSSQNERFEMGASAAAGKGPLAALAYGTDGGFIPAGGNPHKVIQALVGDMTTYYQISYVPPIKEYDGKFRAVSIRPNDKDIRVHTRAGYFAVAPQNSSSFKLFEAPLLKAFSEPQLPSDIKFFSRVLQLGDVGSADGNALAIEVPVSELTTHDDPNTNLYSFHASIVAEIKNKSGEVVEHFSEDMPRHAALDTKEATQNASILMERHFVADPGDYVLEAAVMDRDNQKMGAVRTPFVIAPTGTGPSLSDLTLVQRMEPLPDEIDASDPLKYGNRRIIPNLAARMQRGVKQIDLFSVVHASPHSDQQPRLELTVLRNREPVAQVPLQLRTLTATSSVPYIASLQSGSLRPGDYQLIETLTEGEKSVEKTVSFRIEGPELASATTPSTADAQPATSQDLSMLASAKLQEGAPRQLVITALPESSVHAPSAEEFSSMVEMARKHALAYSKSLPNFVCIETTNRSVDESGGGNWKRRDTLVEMLRFVEGTETRTMLEINGARTSRQRTDLEQTWAISKGEFGVMLRQVFNLDSKTEFHWKEAAALGGATVQVLAYSVSPKNETFVLSDNNKTIGAGFHGLVYVDSATGGVRRVTMEADDIPRDFSIHAASLNVDYEYVKIGTHEYLMPLRAVMMTRRGRHQIDLNEMSFRGYKRFASQSKIVAAP